MADNHKVDKTLGTDEKYREAKRITKKAEQLVDETLARADNLAKEAMKKFPFAEEELKEAQEVKKEASPLAKLSIKSLHTLEKLDSQIRHSVVEVCFYNLKLLCQVFNEKYNQPRFIEKFKENVEDLSSAKSRLEDYFQYKLEDGVTVDSLFEEESDKIREEVKSISSLLANWESRYEDVSYREQISKSIPEKIDLIMSLLGKVKFALEEVKVDVSQLINKAVDLHSEHFKTHNIEVALDVAAIIGKMFICKEAFLDMFCELIRNSIRHGFRYHAEAKKKIIQIKVSPDKIEKNVTINFTDNGKGMDEKTFNSIGDLSSRNSGLSIVKRVVEDQHFGRFNIDSNLSKGTIIEIVLPVKI